MKKCTSFLFLALLLLAGTAQCQELQEFNLTGIRPGWSNKGISLAPYGDGVIALIAQDTLRAPVPIPIYVRIGMLAATLSPNGIVDTMLLQENGEFYDDPPLSSTDGHYEVRSYASDTAALHVLLETETVNRTSLSLAYRWRSRCLRVQGGTSTDILDIGDAYNTRVLRTGSGSRWFVWEARTNLRGLYGPNGSYSATLKAFHISPDGSVGDTVVIGPGFEPMLLAEATGNVRLLYRNSLHSQSKDSISLHTALLTMDGGLEDEHTLLRDLELFNSPLTAVAGSDSTIHILGPGPKSLQHFILGPDAVLRAGLVAERNESRGFILRLTKNNHPIALWYSDDSSGICISEGGSGRLFERIIHLPGTSNVYGFSLDAGPDGLTKVLYVQGSALRVFRNPFASVPESVELVSFIDSAIVPLSWVFASDGSLWLSTFDRYTRRIRSVYRLASPRLGVEMAQLQPGSLLINGFSPHPAARALRVGFSQGRSGSIEYFLFDLLGRCIYNGSAGYFPAGDQAVHIQLPRIPAGTYVLQLRGETTSTQQLFLVR